MVIEQHNLFGGVDLVVPKGRGKRRRLTVESRLKAGFAAALALVVERGKELKEERNVPGLTTCPHCGKEAKTALAFGTRVIRGKRVPQSWCRDCRGLHLKAIEASQLDWLGEEDG